MNNWKWEVEIAAEASTLNGSVNIGGLGPFDTDSAAEQAARALIGGTVADYRAHALADPYADMFEDFAVRGDARVTGACVHRFDDDGIDYASQKDVR